MQPWSPKDYDMAGYAYPDLLKRYLATKLKLAMATAAPRNQTASVDSTADTASAHLPQARFSFAEQITWRTPLRGMIPPTEKEAADKLAVGYVVQRKVWADSQRLLVLAAP